MFHGGKDINCSDLEITSNLSIKSLQFMEVASRRTSANCLPPNCQSVGNLRNLLTIYATFDMVLKRTKVLRSVLGRANIDVVLTRKLEITNAKT